MEVTVLHIADCPNVAPLLADLREVIGDDSTTKLTTRVIEGEAEARALKFSGSPTVLVDGLDPFDGDVQIGLVCRLYMTEQGMSGRPSKLQLMTALSR